MLTLRDRIKEVMLQWGGSMSDLMGDDALEEWIDDLVKAVESFNEEQKQPPPPQRVLKLQA